MYFNEEQNSYKKWIEVRSLNEFVEELQQHYDQETNNTKEKMFYQKLLTKYGQKLDKVQKKEKIQREQEELRICQEKIKKGRLYRKQELLNKEYDEIPLLTKNEIDNFRDSFWEEYKSIGMSTRN
ncbi:hypothetical protein [Bacillus thuringiensis]|uniref:hypothetical protein n=1 Tax=Bacillus thuringiensis TaxID=1428 RepID=UPI003A87270E